MSGSQTRRREEDELSLERIRQFAELMKEYGLSQLELSEKGRRIRLCRGSVLGMAPAVVSPVSTDRPQVSEPAAIDRTKESTKAAAAEDHVVVVTSPMVGTFYNKSSPEAELYVREGDHVGPDTVICLIEAMKVFNEIPAEVSGRVVAVLVENEESVDFGKPLFKIDTSG